MDKWINQGLKLPHQILAYGYMDCKIFLLQR